MHLGPELGGSNVLGGWTQGEQQGRLRLERWAKPIKPMCSAVVP